MTAEEFRIVLEQIAGRGAGFPAYPYVLMALLAPIAVGIGVLVLAYLQERARLYATRDDLDRMEELLHRTTRALEEIRVQIVADTGLRQTRWNFRCETYVALLESLAAMRRAYLRLTTALDERLLTAQEAAPALAEVERDIGAELGRARAQLLRATAVAPVVLRENVLPLVQALEEEAARASDADGHLGLLAAYLEGREAALDRAYQLLVEAAREDLRP